MATKCQHETKHKYVWQCLILHMENFNERSLIIIELVVLFQVKLVDIHIYT